MERETFSMVKFTQATWCALILGFYAAVAFGQIPNRSLTIDVPQQPLATALNSLAEQSEMEILYLSKDVQTLESNEIQGEYEIEQALDLLLADTTLTYSMDGSRRISVQAESDHANTDGGEIDMNSFGTNRVVLAAVASTLAAGAVVDEAIAQQEGVLVAQADTAPTSATSTAESLTLEEVVVTARRREESLQDVPVSISVLNSDFIAQAGILDQFDLFDETPGMFYNQARDRNGARPAIRGVSVRQSQSLRLQKVTAFLDRAPLYGNTGSLAFADIDGPDMGRTPGDKNIHESSGGSSKIDGQGIPDIDGEVIQCMLELEAAPRHPGVVRPADLDDAVDIHQVTRLVDPPRAAEHGSRHDQ